MTSTGKKLYQWQEEHFKSVTEFAKAMGMKASSLYDYFNDVSLPGGKMLQKLQKLGCDIGWLLKDDINYEIPGSDEQFIVKTKEDIKLRNVLIELKDVIENLREVIKNEKSSKAEKERAKKILSAIEGILNYTHKISSQLNQVNNDVVLSLSYNLEKQLTSFLSNSQTDKKRK